VSFYLDSWRDHRGLLKSIGDGGPDKKGLIDALPPQLRAGFIGEKLNKSPLLIWMEEQFQETVQRVGTQYGPGKILSDRLGEYRQRYESNIARWQYGWLGDQVPEMAEHQRGHTQRLLEFASQILVPIFAEDSTFLSELELYILLCAIWLHDIGHAPPKFKVLPSDDKEYFISGFPILIREFHHLTAASLLDEEAERAKKGEPGIYFVKYNDNGSFEREEAIRAIATIARYHRKATPLLEGQPAYEYGTKNWTVKLEEVCPETQTVCGKEVRVRLLTALFRMMDASDVQYERIGVQELKEQREKTIRMETDALLFRLEGLTSALECNPSADALLYTYNGLDKCKACLEALKQLAKCPDCESDVDRWAEEASKDWLCKSVDSINSTNLNFALYTAWLSTATAIAFKARQPKHYEKHYNVKSVVHTYTPTPCSDREYHFSTKVTALTEESGRKALDEIREEYRGVKDLLGNIEGSNGQCSKIVFDSLEGENVNPSCVEVVTPD